MSYKHVATPRVSAQINTIEDDVPIETFPCNKFHVFNLVSFGNAPISAFSGDSIVLLGNGIIGRLAG